MRRLVVSIKPKEARIDKFLSIKLDSLSRSKLKDVINEGKVTVNKKSVRPNYEVRMGDVIELDLAAPTPTEVKAESIPLKIVYEDKDILVINKEAGMVVHPTADHTSGTLVNALLFHLKSLPDKGVNLRPGIVHRLDKGTSGLMVIAKNGEALEDLKEQFKKRTVTKKYLALVQGKVEPTFGSINKPISRHHTNRQKFAVDSNGKEAQSFYKITEDIGGKYSLVEVEPKTGRTHQIRVHMTSLGYPILGDKLYGGKPASRIFLHAAYLEFNHPRTGKKMQFESSLPGPLIEILSKIKESKK